MVDLEGVRREDEVPERMSESAPRQHVDDVEASRVVGRQQKAGWGGEPAKRGRPHSSRGQAVILHVTTLSFLPPALPDTEAMPADVGVPLATSRERG